MLAMIQRRTAAEEESPVHGVATRSRWSGGRALCEPALTVVYCTDGDAISRAPAPTLQTAKFRTHPAVPYAIRVGSLTSHTVPRHAVKDLT